MKLSKLFFSFILLAAASADILQNPDFELPPSGWRANSSTLLFPLNENSTIPGWTFEGGVQYATAGDNFSLPRNGHAILLGQDGKINQTFVTKGEQMQYLLTFTLARAFQNCSSNASLVVSAPDSSAQFSLSGKYGEEPWEVYGHQLGSWGNGESVNLVIESQAVDADPNSTCWPVVDELSLIAIGSVNEEGGNLLPNGGFESGPSFPDFSNSSVLLDSEPSIVESALQQWTITGTVKYVNSKTHFVPEGKSAVEIVSGNSAGVQTAKALNRGSNYNLEFMLGDANDSCSGDFTVGVSAGSTARNFTIRSNGTGSANKYSLAFIGSGPSPTPISFRSYTTRQTEGGVFCGPVIDAVALRDSSGSSRLKVHGGLFVAWFLVMIMKLCELV